VETPAQLEFLKTAGCDEYQGYHFSRPLPAANFERLVRESHTADVLTEEDAIRTHSKLSAYRRS
jgi:predicted signal transduction protein with EAL and GGDEF domain